MSKSNTYIKINIAGLANPVDELPNYGSGVRLIALPEDHDVEVRRDYFRPGNIILIRDNSDNIVRVIHTEETVYLQESSKTLSVHHPLQCTLVGVNTDGTLSLEMIKDNPIVIPDEFLERCQRNGSVDDEAKKEYDYTKDLVDIINLTPDEVLGMVESYDRIFYKAPQHYLLSEPFGWLQSELDTRYGLNLTPISHTVSDGCDYFVLDRV